MRLTAFWIGALCAALACGPLAAGAEVPPAGVEATGEAPRAAEPDSSAAEPSGLDGPTWVMLRSALLPGWGQAKNGAWWKAILVAGVETAFLERLYYEDRRVGVYREKASALPEGSERDAYESRMHRHMDHRRDFTWWTAILLLLSLADAYVDAHLRNFDVRLEGVPAEREAPGAPGGGAQGSPSGVLGPGPAESIGLRVALRLAG